jgi:hypothetical protein
MVMIGAHPFHESGWQYATGGNFERSGRPFAADHAIPREAFLADRRTGRGR